MHQACQGPGLRGESVQTYNTLIIRKYFYGIDEKGILWDMEFRKSVDFEQKLAPDVGHREACTESLFEAVSKISATAMW